MLEITFGEIAEGWAEMTLDFGQERLCLQVSWETEVFSDLAELSMNMLRGQSEPTLRFTNEYELFVLRGALQPNGFYLLRLEQWEPYFDSMQGRTMTESWQLGEVEPWNFGFQLWSELERIKSLPGVLRWHTDDDDCLPEGRFNLARNAKIDELEKALMA